MKLTALPSKTQLLIVEIISALLIVLFVYAGLSKYYERSFFEAQLTFYPLISNKAILLSWLIPFANLFTALLLIIPKSNRIGVYISLIVLSLYTIYLTVMLLTQDDLPCSCGGIIKSLSWKEQWMLNLVLILFALTALLLDKSYQSKHINKQELQ